MIKFLFLSATIFSLSLHFAATSALAADSISQSFRNKHGRFFHLLFTDRTDLRLRYRFEPRGREDGGPGEFELHFFRGDAELPIAMDQDSYVRIGAAYGARHYNFSDTPNFSSGAENLENEILHSPELRFGAGRFFTDDFLATGIIRLGAYSNFSGGLENDDFRLQGDTQLVYRINPGAQLVAGIAATETFEDQFFVPLLGLRLLSGDGKLHISITAPFEARIGYHYTPALEIYGGAWISGEKYRLNLGDNDFKVHIQDRSLGGGISYWLGNHINLLAEAGLLWDSQLEFNTERLDVFRGDLKTAPYLSAGLGFAF